MKLSKPYLLFLIPGILFYSCTKEIDLELPEYEPKLVVEGTIEEGLPPIVFLTKSQAFFGETDINSFENSFVHGATVIVSNGTTTDTLQEFCSSNLPQGADTLIAQFFGVPVDALAFVNICAYTTLNASLFGQLNTNYSLYIESEGKSYHSNTKIPNRVALDSVWFEGEPSSLPHGFAYAILTDPDTLGNGYRWYDKRLNMGDDGFPKDYNFQKPFGNAFFDEFFNGTTFEFAYARSDSDRDDENDRQGYYRIGDTIVIKFCSIPYESAEYFQFAESQAVNNGNPFSSPANNPTNIEGGALGIWTGYAVTYDTIIAQ